jgi:peptide/nickel transport system permease protein
MKALWNKFKSSTIYRVGIYFSSRLIMVSLTIFVGIFITVVIANKTNQFNGLRSEALIKNTDRITSLDSSEPWEWSDAEMELWTSTYEELMKEEGDRPFFTKHLDYTISALKFDLGVSNIFSSYNKEGSHSASVKDIIFEKLSSTLLLISSSYLIVFLIGIPISLSFSRNQGKFFDRIFTLLSPLSSVPAWVLGIIFIFIFAVDLKIFPPGGLHTIPPPENMIEYYLDMAKHLALPVITLVVSLLMQFIFIWRTYFLIYSEEDYVELATAMGLKKRILNRRHILRPTLPFIFSSIALSLISLWQIIVAIEKVFNLDGIGFIFMNSLPHYFGENYFPGEMRTVVGIAVVFAYLLGLIVLVLDVLYSIVDPRIRLDGTKRMGASAIVRGNILKRLSQSTKNKLKQLAFFFVSIGSKIIAFFYRFGKIVVMIIDRNRKGITHLLVKRRLKKKDGRKIFFDNMKGVIGKFFKEFKKFPSAIFGFVYVSIMIIVSIFLLLSPEYKARGENWTSEILTGKAVTPKFAKPEWVNWFRKDDYPPTIYLNTENGDGAKDQKISENGNPRSTITFDFKFPYGFSPQEIDMHFNVDYTEKRPFSIVTLIRPDGSEIELDGFSTTSNEKIDFEEKLSTRLLLMKNPMLKEWFVETGYQVSIFFPQYNYSYTSDTTTLAFADFDSSEPVVLEGDYKLIVETLFFEKDGGIDLEVIMMGHVAGIAGTDYMRRDLSVPLLWGMPYALLIGISGAIITTLSSLFLGAISAWRRGWVDKLIERITELNMVIPMLVIGILLYTLYSISIWWVLIFMVLMNAIGSPTKTFRAAFLQVVESPYIEAAQAYGASNWRIITRYLIPRIMPMVIPQLVLIIPSFIFLEATLGLFNIKMVYPTWGKIISDALKHGAIYGSRYWVLQPIILLIFTGVAFVLIGNALEKILNPKLMDK